MRECAAWVHAGGHAVLYETPKKARLVVPHFGPEDMMALGRWAILDLGKSTYGIPRKGPLRGLVTTPLEKDILPLAQEWVERDSIHPRAQRKVDLDCLACGACCRDNDVVLEPVDKRRMRKAKLDEFLAPPYTRKRGGKLVLRVLANGKCRHLKQHNMCAIYTHRPDACSQFPQGSECCLFAREEELDIVDGLRPQAAH